MRIRPLLLILSAALLMPTAATGHEIRPALLQLQEKEAGFVEVTWKVPVLQGRALDITPRLPETWKPVAPPARVELAGAALERSLYRSDGRSLAGGVITIEGLERQQVDALIQITLADGTHHSAVVRPSRPQTVIPTRAAPAEVALSYWTMGVVHIWEGADHLLFLAALLFLIDGLASLLRAVTAFTAGHSLTLVLATLDAVRVPAAPTEAVISLSIVFLAWEIVRGRGGLGERRPWRVACLFGGVHGLGFAGALAEIGVPAHAVPTALFAFNAGVETGQVLFLAALWPALAAARRWPVEWPLGEAWRGLPYAIGGLASFWTLDRLAGMF